MTSQHGRSPASSTRPAGTQISGKIAVMFQRLTTGPAATVLGAVLLIAGGIVVVAGAGTVGTVVAAAGCAIIVRERIRVRQR
jgi:hypothetical protein